MEVFKLRLYRISADGGDTWSEQYLTAAESAELRELYHYICELVRPNDFKEIYCP